MSEVWYEKDCCIFYDCNPAFRTDSSGKRRYNIRPFISEQIRKAYISPEKKNFTYASNFLSFYGKSDIKAARSKWAQDMLACGIEFKEIHCDKLWGDDGIAQANASALLENGEEISFRIIVQGNGLSISGVSDNNGINEDYSRLMTTYNPG